MIEDFPTSEQITKNELLKEMKGHAQQHAQNQVNILIQRQTNKIRIFTIGILFLIGVTTTLLLYLK